MPVVIRTSVAGADAVAAQVAGIDRHMPERVKANFMVLGVRITRWMQEAVEPIRFKGRLAGSISSEIDADGMTLKVGPTAKHAAFVYYGTRPHWAPIAPLKEWARWKLGSEDAAYAVQKSIARYGTSQYLIKAGVPGAWHSPYGVGLDFLRVVTARGDFKNALDATAQRIGSDLIGGVEERWNQTRG